MMVLDFLKSVKEFGKRKVESWWDSGQWLIEKVQSWRGSVATGRLHPWLRVPLLALLDAANLFIVGIGLMVSTAIILVLLCSFMLLMMTPYLVIASWLSSYLLPPVNQPFHPSVLMRHTFFILASIVLCGVLYLLNRSVKSTNPESNFAEFLLDYVEGLPWVPWIIVSCALWTVCSACVVVFTFDFTLAIGWGFIAISYILYYALLFCYFVIRHVPWFVLLPLVIFVPLFVVSLFRQVGSCSNQDEDDPEERIETHQATTYGTV
ncbi:hypothetical protein R1flu_020697 [Riccia fluitans]|uniref:Uncharacterized protein n=1 Tax=Riccia fluitans TaxID=41844 RepID=A0ABD1ZQQ3_9MARC